MTSLSTLDTLREDTLLTVDVVVLAVTVDAEELQQENSTFVNIGNTAQSLQHDTTYSDNAVEWSSSESSKSSLSLSGTALVFPRLAAAARTRRLRRDTRDPREAVYYHESQSLAERHINMLEYVVVTGVGCCTRTSSSDSTRPGVSRMPTVEACDSAVPDCCRLDRTEVCVALPRATAVDDCEAARVSSLPLLSPSPSRSLSRREIRSSMSSSDPCWAARFACPPTAFAFRFGRCMNDSIVLVVDRLD